MSRVVASSRQLNKSQEPLLKGDRTESAQLRSFVSGGQIVQLTATPSFLFLRQAARHQMVLAPLAPQEQRAIGSIALLRCLSGTRLHFLSFRKSR